MPRYKLTVEYHGGPFAGWQRQKGAHSVQEALEDALRALEPDMPSIAAAGRTDAGVHALGQVAHCDLKRTWDPFRLMEAVNHHIRPNPVSIVAAEEVGEDFHARFSAVERRYMYRIVVRRAPLTLEKGLVWKVGWDLDADAMREGAAHLVGHHDFTTFRAAQCQSDSPVKTIVEIRVEETASPLGPEIQLHVRARSFLHNQVRSFAGTLERVGAGKWTPGDVKTALEAKDRAACGPVAPPQGLYLVRVVYPD
jgi:tRNA pseudouridine38-40 synthase